MSQRSMPIPKHQLVGGALMMSGIILFVVAFVLSRSERTPENSPSATATAAPVGTPEAAPAPEESPQSAADAQDWLVPTILAIMGGFDLTLGMAFFMLGFPSQWRDAFRNYDSSRNE